MKRSDFLRTMLLGGAATTVGAVVVPTVSKAVATADAKVRLCYLYSGSINGTMHYNASEVYGQMKHNDLLTLRLEPTNKHDHRAIEVLWQGHKLGYVPRTDNKVLYNLMKDGTPVVARLKKMEAKPWDELDQPYSALRMRVWMHQTTETTATDAAKTVLPPMIPAVKAKHGKQPSAPHQTNADMPSTAASVSVPKPVWTEELRWQRIALDQHQAEVQMQMHCLREPDGTFIVDGFHVLHANHPADEVQVVPVLHIASGTMYTIEVMRKGAGLSFKARSADGQNAPLLHDLAASLNRLPTQAQDSLMQSLNRDLWQPIIDLERAIDLHTRQAMGSLHHEVDAIGSVLHENFQAPIAAMHHSLAQSVHHATHYNSVATKLKGVRAILMDVRNSWRSLLRR
jgi:hypothetical protein